MAESLAGWLALREPFDHAARAAALTGQLVERLPRDRPLRIVDLGTGTGSNIRYLSARLPVPQDWLAVDRDPALLALVPPHVTTSANELGPLDHRLLADRQLVTASALLDLVSPQWLDDLARACGRVKAAALFALSYDGRSQCVPTEPEDDAVRELFNRHQRQNDKGFGTAAGPDAVACALKSFSAAGYRVATAPSDWQIPPHAAAFQQALIQGWIDASSEIDPSQTAMIRDWGARRLAHVAAGRSEIAVGHQDLIGWLE